VGRPSRFPDCAHLPECQRGRPLAGTPGTRTQSISATPGRLHSRQLGPPLHRSSLSAPPPQGAARHFIRTFEKGATGSGAEAWSGQPRTFRASARDCGRNPRPEVIRCSTTGQRGGRPGAKQGTLPGGDPCKAMSRVSADRPATLKGRSGLGALGVVTTPKGPGGWAQPVRGSALTAK